MGDKKTLSRQRSFMSRQAQHEAEVNVVVTKTTIVTIGSKENDKNIVTTQKWMLRHNNEPKVDIFVVTKENYVARIKAAKSEIFVAIEKFFVMTENRREVR